MAGEHGPKATRYVGAGLIVAGAFILLSGFLLVVFSTYPEPFHLALFMAGIALPVAGLFTMRGHGWAWGLAWGLVAAGAIWAIFGLVRGYSSGLIGLAVWGTLGYGLLREDVRTHCGVA